MIYPDVTHLYMYKPANAFTKSIFRDQLLWAPKPGHFNDPFDCDLEATKGITEDDLLATVRMLYGRPDDWPVDVRRFLESALNAGKFTPAERERLDREISAFIDENKNSGVLCLAEVSDSILMWSHYAEHHRGICIEFHRSAGNALGDAGLCSPVKYSSKYPVIDFGRMLLNRDGHTADLIMRLKADCWAYEREWRLITDQGDKACPLPGEISKVIFGLRAEPDFKKSIQELCNQRGIRTVQAAKGTREFNIVIPD